MKHYFLPDNLLGKETIIFKDRDFHYLKHVLRLKKGSTFPGIDKQGIAYNLHISRETAHTLVAEFIVQPEISGDEAEISLCQCLLKGKKQDRIIRQATEAGVARIIPVISEYTIIKINKAEVGNKMERWQRIAREAMQQSGNTKVPVIEQPHSLKDLDPGSGLALFFHQEPVSGRSLHNYLAESPRTIRVFIGPEGGISEVEIPQLRDKGFQPVFLGKTVLRAETAAIFAIAAIKIILTERKDWRLN